MGVPERLFEQRDVIHLFLFKSTIPSSGQELYTLKCTFTK